MTRQLTPASCRCTDGNNSVTPAVSESHNDWGDDINPTSLPFTQKKNRVRHIVLSDEDEPMVSSPTTHKAKPAVSKGESLPVDPKLAAGNDPQVASTMPSALSHNTVDGKKTPAVKNRLKAAEARTYVGNSKQKHEQSSLWLTASK